MYIATDKKITKETIIAGITFILLISPFSLIRAEDYPAGFLGPGYREYLSEKKQNGYYVDVFTKIDLLQKERVAKRNQAEEIAAYASQAEWMSADSILGIAVEHINYINALNQEIALQRQQREKTASAEGEFTYIPSSDGKKIYFKDGLVSRIESERVVDEFGNMSLRNSYNYQYDGNRLLTGFEADTTDLLGNTTHIRQYGIKYTADSLFYSGKDTRANKNITEYFMEEIDSAGNKKSTHFYAGAYEGKFLRAFSETIEDSIQGKASFTRSNIQYAGGDPSRISSYHEEGIGTDGLAYTLDRTNISYNGKDQLTGYHEETSIIYPEGGVIKKTVDAQFKYLGVDTQFGPDVEEPDPDRLLESIISATEENPDGSTRTETNTTIYKYDGTQFTDASGHSVFNGQEVKYYEYTYTDAQGQAHTLSRNEDENGNITYSYVVVVDPITQLTITVSAGQVTSTLKDGNKYSGTTEVQYEIPYGKPMTKQVDSIISYYHPDKLDLLRTDKSQFTYTNGLVNNLLRTLDTKEHAESIYTQIDAQGNPQTGIKDIATTYIYAENGNLIDAQGTGTGSGYELTNIGWRNYNSIIALDYEVILGEAKRKQFKEEKLY